MKARRILVQRLDDFVMVRGDMARNGELYTGTLFLTEDHQRIKALFDMNDNGE